MSDLGPAPPDPDIAASGHDHDVAQRILDGLEQVIVGQRRNLAMVMACLLSGGHVLLEDRPGVGKTMLARAIGAVLGRETKRVQGTPDLLPSDITGVHVFDPRSGDWSFRAGPVFAPVLLVDELNRATPKAQSALLEAMAERQVTVDGATMSLPADFMVIATQNPRGEVGTHPLGHAQLDRFAISLHLGLPTGDAERRILLGEFGSAGLAELEPVVSEDDLTSLRRRIAELPVSDGIVDYILDVVREFRSVEGTWLGVRVTETVLRVARGHAVFAGREYVAPEDVQSVVPRVLAHRLPPAFDAASILGVLSTVDVPVAAG